MRLPLLLVLACAALASACFSGDSADSEPTGTTPPNTPAATAPASTPTTAPDPTATAEPTPSATAEPTATAEAPTSTPVPVVASACGEPMPTGLQPGSAVTLQLASAGRDRTFRVHLPVGYDSGSALPVVLNFHGLGGSGQQQESLSGLLPLADTEGFALVSPDGTGVPRAFNVLGLFPSSADDLQFTADLLDHLATIVCTDASRIYATGFSNGGFMATLLACRLPERFAAVAPVGGLTFPATGCTVTVPILAIHGTADAVIPFNPGSILGIAAYAGVREHLANWAELGNCRADAYPEPLTDTAHREGYPDCDGGGSINLVVLEGFDHRWPRESNAGLSAADLIWEFFSRHP